MRILAALLALQTGCAAPYPTRSANVPQRAAVASDTATAAPDTVAVEVGLDVDPSDAWSAAVSALWGAGPRTELFADTVPAQAVERDGVDESGVGDLRLGVRHRFVVETAVLPSMALQLVTKIPTAEDANGLGTGQLDTLVALITSRSFEAAYLSGSYELGVLGQSDSSTAIQHQLAASAAQAWTERLGAFVEVASVVDSDLDPEHEPVFLTAALTWAVTPDFVLDVGIVARLEDDAPDDRYFLGFTRRFGLGRRAP